MKSLLHTFVIVAYKESPYLEECICSLLAQTIQSCLLLSTSTPSTFVETLARKYDIPMVINTNRDGIAVDWSFAYEAADTPYVTLAHQDDRYFPEYTEQCLNAAQSYHDNLITFTDYYEQIGTRRRHSLLIPIKRMLLWPFSFRIALKSTKMKMICLLFGNPIPCPSVMYHKETIRAFEFSNDWQFNLDWDAWLRFAQRQGHFVYVKKPLIAHRLHQDSETSRLIRNQQRAREELLMLQRLWGKRWGAILAKFYQLGAIFNPA
ncbi:glycosyltransferase, putative teichoic acid biosynthesis protein [Candidatus Moduliflexus flocculans]|uniref:Glycosyltransferase, putative teichoic acid biosynthesis protein n=1 Tax=Candidatus Moduliflexus flocculans TaxID=1499966 RepID=A0A081BQS6_9BACT|nr:glycosyltransferase, putative teichoic acid biosynthesis protein [Candidatus Moduliflexus flocculans]